MKKDILLWFSPEALEVYLEERHDFVRSGSARKNKMAKKKSGRRLLNMQHVDDSDEGVFVVSPVHFL